MLMHDGGNDDLRAVCLVRAMDCDLYRLSDDSLGEDLMKRSRG